jgi:chromosome segregation ATPase
MSLRKEFQELKSATNTTADVQDKIHKQQRAGANNVGETLPPVRSEKSDTCDAVKGIVKHIEKKIWRHQSTLGTTESATIQRLMDHATRFPGLAEDLEEVRDELNLERLQVVELEDELTRQCEINCALLKEISTLATENESSRNSRAQSFGVVNAEICDNQKKEIDRLMIEVANFKSKLLNVEKSKSKLENDLAMMEKENAELQTVRKQLKLAESDARRIASQMENTSLLSSAEISSLQRQVDELEDKLSTAEHKIKELEQAEASNPSTDGLEKMKEEFDQLRRLDQDTINFFKTKVSELEAEIANARDEAKSSQMVESLEAQVAVLQASLRKGDVARAELESERENLVAEVERLNNNRKEPDDTSEEQQLRLEELQQLVDQKVEQFEKLRAGDQQQISSLRNEVVSLERQLSSARQQLEALSLQLQKRDEVEDQVDVLARKNVESLHAQINKLQNEMMKKQVELSESEVESAKEISALEDTIERMNAEMDQTIASKSKEIDELRRTIDTKEQKIRQIETEKEQLLLSMNEMMKNRRDEIDELQSEFMEMSSKAANQAREVQTLKLLLAESDYRKDEMDRLRARVTELSDQVSSRGDNKRSQSTSSINGDRTLTDLEVENSSLRQKLRKAVSEKQSAEEKLRDYVENKEGTSRTVQVLRERNTALKFEVEKLTRKLQKAQGLRRMSSSTDSSRNSRSTSDRSQNKLHQRTLGTVSSQSSEESSKIESIRFVI